MDEKNKSAPMDGNGVPVYLVQAPPPIEETQGDLLRFWLMLKQYRLTIGLSTAFFTVLAVAYAMLAEPVYRAQTLVASVQSSDQPGGLASLAGQFGGLASLAGLRFGGGAEKAQAIAILRSRGFTELFIRENNLMPVLFEDDWDPDAGKWDVDDPDDIPTMADAYELFDQDIRSVSEDSETGLVVLTIDWKDPQQAADWANRMIARLNDYLRKISIEESNASIAFLNEELQASGTVELRQAIFRLIEQQIEMAMLANTQKEFAFKVLDRAVAPDDDDYVWPLRPVIVVFGLMLGALLGIGWALLMYTLGVASQPATPSGTAATSS